MGGKFAFGARQFEENGYPSPGWIQSTGKSLLINLDYHNRQIVEKEEHILCKKPSTCMVVLKEGWVGIKSGETGIPFQKEFLRHYFNPVPSKKIERLFSLPAERGVIYFSDLTFSLRILDHLIFTILVLANHDVNR